MNASSIACLKVTLDVVRPKVQRRIEVPLLIQLDQLHLVLQAALGWTNSHLYEIRARGTGWGMPDPDFGDRPLDARKTRLANVLEDTGATTLRYLYDFGDGWKHTVKVERVVEAVPGITYPRLTEASGRCPPEDVGGPLGYGDFLDAVSNPDHEEHTEILRWVGGDFGPKAVDIEALIADVAALAREWTRKPPVKRTSIH